MKTPARVVIEVEDIDIVENLASDIEADLKCANGVKSIKAIVDWLEYEEE